MYEGRFFLTAHDNSSVLSLFKCILANYSGVPDHQPMESGRVAYSTSFYVTILTKTRLRLRRWWTHSLIPNVHRHNRPDKTVASASRRRLDNYTEHVQTLDFLVDDSLESSRIQFTSPTRCRRDSFVGSGVPVWIGCNAAVTSIGRDRSILTNIL